MLQHAARHFAPGSQQLPGAGGLCKPSCFDHQALLDQGAMNTFFPERLECGHCGGIDRAQHAIGRKEYMARRVAERPFRA
jgi:hypothetical protein